MNRTQTGGHSMRLLLVALFTTPPALGGGDHHMHIYSTDGAAVWMAMCEVIPGGCDEYELPVSGRLTAADAVLALDNAGLDKGAVLSLAYFYGFPRLAGSEFDDHRYVRSENEYVMQQVSLFPQRLVGFFSLNPLADYAVEEARHWGQRGGLAGLKLHLTNSAVDFDNPAHIGRLREILEITDGYAMPVVIHLRTREPDYGYAQASLFIDEVASQLPSTTWYLAHMAGWGGYDPGTDGAVRAFLDAIETGRLDRSRIWFDLAAIDTAELSAEDLGALRDKIRRIGVDRVLFASDWDEVEPLNYRESLRNGLGLDEAEWNQLIENEAPFFE